MTKVITVLCILIAAFGLLLISGPLARLGAARPLGNQNPNGDPKLFTPWRTFFDQFSGTPSTPYIIAQCDSAYCVASAPIFSEQALCPEERGGSCTFQITIESHNELMVTDGLPIAAAGKYVFTVDGVAPHPGPTGGAGNYIWTQGQILLGVWVASSVAVTAEVTNATWNQKHAIVVAIGCLETQGDTSGCTAATDLANLQVAIYRSDQEPF
jgi:hypothetical protein